MLSHEENELITRTGPSTPGGETLRRYWQPVALAAELPGGSAPLPVRIMSENLVLFRDESGQPGLLGIHCAHRGADLSYARLEDGGLRCIYHGWLYDRTGRCLEQPGEPAGSTFHERIHQPAYQCVEVGGFILAYLGPGEPPLVPNYDFLSVPEGNRVTTKLLHECNYHQANEGNLDPQHLGVLHRTFDDDGDGNMALAALDLAPMIEAEETSFGASVFSMRRVGPSRRYIRVNHFILPNISAFPVGREQGYNVRDPAKNVFPNLVVTSGLIDDSMEWRAFWSMGEPAATT